MKPDFVGLDRSFDWQLRDIFFLNLYFWICKADPRRKKIQLQIIEIPDHADRFGCALEDKFFHKISEIRTFQKQDATDHADRHQSEKNPKGDFEFPFFHGDLVVMRS